MFADVPDGYVELMKQPKQLLVYVEYWVYEAQKAAEMMTASKNVCFNIGIEKSWLR